LPNINKWGVDLDSIRDGSNRIRTVSLFVDAPGLTTSTEPPVYALRAGDYKGVVSLKDIYLEVADPTEYDFALQALGSWEAWQRLAGPDGPQWFVPYITAWRDELEIKLRREAFLHMRKLAEGKTDAAKWLAEGKWNSRSAGRPSKEETKRELGKLASIHKGYEDDAVRLGLVSTS